VPVELLRREFHVDAPLTVAWADLADVESWPRWAPHISRVTVDPPGPIGPSSSGALSFRPMGGSRFRVSSYAEGEGWEWVGRVLWLSIRYDHGFEPVAGGTRLTWTVSQDGARRTVLGRLFGSVYARLVDRAIPRLQEQLKSTDRGA
jgi:carbon monoxide dehydrogenase subunit G